MKSIQRAHILVVAGTDQRLMLAAQLCRLEVTRATFVSRIEEARAHCLTGGPDLCLVCFDDPALDTAPHQTILAPGHEGGVPSLLLVEPVTPYLRRLARQNGYFAAIPGNLAPRMLYRRMSAALRHPVARPAGRPSAPPISANIPLAADFAEWRKATRH